ncbi:MAG: hypothetical protein ACMUFK_03595, partial [Thermoplasmatota archaeon]
PGYPCYPTGANYNKGNGGAPIKPSKQEHHRTLSLSYISEVILASMEAIWKSVRKWEEMEITGGILPEVGHKDHQFNISKICSDSYLIINQERAALLSFSILYI